MAISREKKEEILGYILEELENSDLVIFMNYKSLDAAGMTELRGKVREANAKFKVVKNTLGILALQQSQRPIPEDIIDGVTAWGFCQDDIAKPVKALKDFIKDYKDAPEGFGIKGGIMGQDILSVAQVEELANLPTKEVLLAQVVGTIKSPISGFVNVLCGPMRGLVNVLNGRVDQLEQAT